MQANKDTDRDLIEALQVATRDLLAVALQSLAAGGNLKLPHMRLMIAVHENPGAASVALADHLGVSPSSVTRQADYLCDSGLLTRDQHPDSRRVVVLSLTPKGEQVVADVLAFRAQALAKALPAIDPGLLPAMTKGLRQLHDALRSSRNLPRT